MKLRCREGEMALIIKEEPGCECNIGKAVTVHSPIRNCPDKGPVWLIQPVQPEFWAVREYRGQPVWIGVVTACDLVEHPDGWLLPLRPADELDWLAQKETHRRVIKLGEGKLIDQHVFFKAVTIDDVTAAGLPVEMAPEERT